MSILAAPPLPVTNTSRSTAARARWTVDEFHKFAGLPIFANRKMILVDGEVLDMPLANHPHDVGVSFGQTALGKIFDASIYWVRNQMALPLGQSTDPGPDLAVVQGAIHSHTRQPTTALLVVEVSDTSLDYDTGDKANLYAAGGILDYWVVDINNRQLHVFRDPIADPVEPFGFRYQTRYSLDSTATINPLAMPNAAIRVADLL